MKAARVITEKLGSLRVRTALVLGSGLGELVHAVDGAVRIPYREIPGFPEGGVSGHSGELVAGMLYGVPVLILSGRVHYYERGDADAMRPVLEALRQVGIERLILTNAAGSLRSNVSPASVMLIEDHINWSGLNPLIGESSDARFVSMTEAYDAKLRSVLDQAANEIGVPLAKGVYMWFSGPSFETPAEIRMAQMLGADAVGMSTVPEVILARFFGMRVAACSVITNLGAGMTGAELSHQETKDVAPLGGKRLSMIIKKAFEIGFDQA
ncbi:purine-nucleoside phosphorylase [Limoniibacter endophyticus]|uniref:Purine nucleoside phosphorylase n=1 Tax=Limoniibacter endophyticus TaxID=1565040 RepID=A0A8J3DIG0_9HYPH|nr:purine-nucleoside phosphorylase [Limoniibacter endophyticus]GHC74687.1 purine nucleoside phosphorylase [Limoniibacter endophyticus]